MIIQTRSYAFRWLVALILIQLWLLLRGSDAASEVNVSADTSTMMTAIDNGKAVEERVYFMKKLAGGGCPYMASWLANVNLFRRVTWWIDITKMEAASFNM